MIEVQSRCGHPTACIVSSGEGTNYCGWCEDVARLRDAQRWRSVKDEPPPSRNQNYIDGMADRIGRKIGMSLADPVEAELLRLYAVLACAKGRSTTREDVHDAWAAWASKHWPDHHSLVPFGMLSADTQAKDQEYVDAISKAAMPQEAKP